jgi:hypothetical protein
MQQQPFSRDAILHEIGDFGKRRQEKKTAD